MTNLPIWTTPYPIHGLTRNQLRKYAEEGIDDLIYKLTHTPEAPEEKVPKVKPTGMIEFRDIDYADVYEKFNRLFLERRWGDGIPLVPPTREKVDWMLTGTDRSPDEIIARIHPSQRAATVESIATNAVMAGAIPAYMPVIITAVEALDDPCIFKGCAETMGACAPMLVINGPIAKQLDINSKAGYQGPGWRANATIGRTIMLLWDTVGGSIPGWTRMNTTGMPHLFNCIVFAEDREQLDRVGWASYSEEQGFDRETNTVTATAAFLIPHGVVSIPSSVDTAKGVLEVMVKWATPYNHQPGGGPRIIQPTFIFNEVLARLFTKEGWTKDDIKKAYVKLCDEKWSMPIEEYHRTVAATDVWYKQLSEEEKAGMRVPLFTDNPERMIIFMAGGAIHLMHYFSLRRKTGGDWVIREIKLPANWDRVLAEANIKPHPHPVIVVGPSME